MKDWQNYATEVKGTSTIRPLRMPPSQPNTSTDTAAKISKPFSKTWFHINITLVALCGVAILFGLWYAISYTIQINNATINPVHPMSFFGAAVEGTAMSFIFPGALLLWLYVLAVEGSVSEMNPYAMVYGMIVSILLGVCLVANAVSAIASMYQNRKNPATRRISRLNCLFALIPPIFIIMTLILLFFSQVFSIIT